MSDALYGVLAAQLGVAPEEFPWPLYAEDRDGRIAFCNAAFAQLVGRNREEIVGRLSILFYPPEATPGFLMRRVQALLGEAVRPNVRSAMRRAGGSTVPVEISATSLKDGAAIVGRVVIAREVRTDGNPEARPNVEYLFQLSPEQSDALPYGLIVLDPEGVVVGYNQAESRLSGLARQAVIGRNFFRDIAPCTRVQSFSGLYADMVKAREPHTAQFDFLFRFRHGDQRVFILLAYLPKLRRGLILVDQNAAQEPGSGHLP